MYTSKIQLNDCSLKYLISDFYPPLAMEISLSQLLKSDPLPEFAAPERKAKLQEKY